VLYSKGSHTKFYHRYHVVWVTKYRYKVLRGPMRERIRDIIRQVCEELGVHIEKGVLSTDHIHRFISVPPHIALSKVMQRMKGRSSYKIQREYPDLIPESQIHRKPFIGCVNREYLTFRTAINLCPSAFISNYPKKRLPIAIQACAGQSILAKFLNIGVHADLSPVHELTWV